MEPKHSGPASVTPCYVFAVINTVFCSVCVVGSLAFLGVVVASRLDASTPLWFGASRGANHSFFLGISLACTVGSIVSLAFAILLWIGLEKNKPGYLTCYLVYGVVTVALSVVGCVGRICMALSNTPFKIYNLIPLGICALYWEQSGLVPLVHRARAKLAARAPAPPQNETKNIQNYYPKVTVMNDLS